MFPILDRLHLEDGGVQLVVEVVRRNHRRDAILGTALSEKQVAWSPIRMCGDVISEVSAVLEVHAESEGQRFPSLVSDGAVRQRRP
jgi:hypothetical protein